MKRTPWRERIVKARRRGKFTSYEMELASNWPSCAVGEQRRLHPDLIKLVCDCGSSSCTSGPLDQILFDLGHNEAGFGAAVVSNEIDKAEGFLDAIEDRVLVLKREATP